MWSSKIRLFFGIVWILSGASKVLALIAELITGKAMISLSIPFFVKSTVVPFCANMVNNYILPYALLYIFIAALIEIKIGFLILQPGGWARLGLSLGIFLTVIYTPLVGWFLVITGILLFAVPHIWLLGQDLKENLFENLLKKIRRR